VNKSSNPASDIRSKSIAAVGWSAIDVVGRQGISFVVTLILARLLSPAQFGLIGMLTLFIALASALVDSGFGSALIQRRELTEVDKASVFYFNAAMGALMALVIFAAAPWISEFYREPILLNLTRWMALNLFIDSFGVVQVALLQRNLDFRTMFKVNTVAIITSGALAVFMAWRGYGVWSLVAQAVSFTSVFTGLIWMYCPWKPTLQFRMESLRLLFGFGSRLLASGLLNTFFDRIQLAVIGKAFSATQLGYYTRAFTTQQFPVTVLANIVNRVTFPVFSQLSGQIDMLRRGVQRALVSLMIPTLPMMLGLAVVAKPLVLVMFGSKWLPCVPYLQILSIAGVFWPVHLVNLNVATALGRSDLFLRLEVVKKVVIALGILCTFRISVMAMVWATLVVSVVCVIVNTHYTKSLIGYGLLSQLQDLVPYAGVAMLMAIVAWAVCALFADQPVLQLTLSVFAGATFYCTACHLLKLKVYRYALASVLAQCFMRQEVPAVATVEDSTRLHRFAE
jgi:O-antigen/teichoic acid export membrane protein